MARKLFDVEAFADIRALLSPSFFDVMPPGKLVSTAKELYDNFRDKGHFREIRNEVASLLRAAQLPIELSDATPASNASDPNAVLRLYFLQLFHLPRAILDLRPGRFGATDGALVWNPAPIFIRWDSDFIGALRQVYRTYYTESEEAFERAVEEIGLPGMADVFERHFGRGDQRAVEFRLDHFRATFRTILQRCKEENIQLHANFGPLGMYLATLYQHLGQCGGTYDVRAAATWAMSRDRTAAPPG